MLELKFDSQEQEQDRIYYKIEFSVDFKFIVVIRNSVGTKGVRKSDNIHDPALYNAYGRKPPVPCMLRTPDVNVTCPIHTLAPGVYREHCPPLLPLVL
ncbi:hypothetical protein EVAR_66673_1 [Eumeta japonica]|uniref:Uncharacterized protein n=1 Tax=Eumeta variegata TaxID=151549 RepID=A0A4C1ZJS7_EUMVA|nr:hypothetical protein EVAR_66673_1 [Eumeta japonica]